MFMNKYGNEHLTINNGQHQMNGLIEFRLIKHLHKAHIRIYSVRLYMAQEQRAKILQCKDIGILNKIINTTKITRNSFCE